MRHVVELGCTASGQVSFVPSQKSFASQGCADAVPH
jgi:hypothetical protein